MERIMPIPDYQTLMLPVLGFAAERELPTRECVDLIAKKFELSQDEREQLLPSGKQTTVSNRVHWAASYLVQAGLLERPRRGVIVAARVC
jgi:restriction system protein